MKFDYALLRSRMRVRKINVTDLAKKIGITSITLYKKFENENFFNQKEIVEICKILDITNIADYFFCKERL